MLTLFKRCLEADYIHTPESGEYAIEVGLNTLYLFFEKSDGAEDWKNNFDFPAEPYRDMSVKWLCHRGFLRVWRAMKDEIELKVYDILHRNRHIKNIVCVGYSHGGAIAVLATEDMEYLYGETHKVKGIGFGAPRVLFGKVPPGVKNRLKGFVTVRNIPDIVTHLPPLIMGYKNAGELYKIGEIGKYNPIDAHRPTSYIDELDFKKELGEVKYIWHKR